MGDTVFKVMVFMGCEPIQAGFKKILSGDFFSDRSQQKSCSSDGDVKANEQQTLTNIQVSATRVTIDTFPHHRKNETLLC